MTQLKEIVCYQKENDKYYLEDTFSGRILIYDNNKFEGIVSDFFHDNVQFVFGSLTPGGIRVFRTTSGDKEVPKVYMGERTKGKRYEGQIAATSRFAHVPLADCKVSIIEPDSYRDVDYEQEQKDMPEAIANFKKRLGEEGLALYENEFYDALRQKEQNAQK